MLRTHSIWDVNLIQFPRLLAEIMATQEELNVEPLAEAMDLRPTEVIELLERAQSEWEMYKSPTGHHYAVSDRDLFINDDGVVQHESWLVMTHRNAVTTERWALAWVRIEGGNDE